MVAVVGQSRRPLRHLGTGVMDAASSVAHAANTRAVSAMTYTTEEFVRRELRSILRGDTDRTRFVCLTCLVTMTLERLHAGWRKSEITRALDRIYATPGTSMTSGAAVVCAHCRKTMPCLRAGA